MRIRSLLLLSLLALSAPAPGSGAEPPSSVAVRGKTLLVDGAPFVVKGVHYGPWRPGTGPGKGYPYPSPEQIAEDLRMIRQLNANTILVYDPPEYVLDLAQEHGLRVFYTFHIDWWTLPVPEARRRDILERVGRFRDKPALLGWVLGNEIPTYALDQQGKAAFERELEGLYRAVKAVDPRHPVTHAGWPITKDLALGFLDIAAFNVYPLWPPEVVAMGYGRYVREVLQPIAGDRPLLVTEFGANALEAGEEGQLRLIRESWDGLMGAGAVGGFVFEFADEWWKNYTNPRREHSWWDRVDAPADEATRDLDPEETYGLVTAERVPKPAYFAVREMYDEGPRAARLVPRGVVGLLILLAVGSWSAARLRTRRVARAAD